MERSVLQDLDTSAGHIELMVLLVQASPRLLHPQVFMAPQTLTNFRSKIVNNLN